MGKNLAWLVTVLVLVAVASAVPVRSPITQPAPEPQPSVIQVTATMPADLTAPEGRWALKANGYRLLLELTLVPESLTWVGRLQNENGAWEPVEHISIRRAENPAVIHLEFCRAGPTRQWFRCKIFKGGLTGHVSHNVDPRAENFTFPVKGWHPPPPGWKVGH